MSDTTIDLPAAHRHFSSSCFNATWDLLDKAERSPAEDDEMLALARVSLWHWSQRDDCGPTQRSLGHWLISRVHAVRGEARSARLHGERCLSESVEGGLSPFYRGYGHEALARAAAAAPTGGGRSGDDPALADDDDPASRRDQHLAQARHCLEAIDEAENRALLAADLEALEAAAGGGVAAA